MRVLLLLLFVVATACASDVAGGSGDAAAPPAGDPYIEGTVSNVTPGDPGTILVKEVPDGNQASLRVTAVWRETPDGLVRAGFEDLAAGQTVAAWVSGPIAESFPVQATADAVVIRA